jgi:hypothetical protein
VDDWSTSVVAAFGEDTFGLFDDDTALGPQTSGAASGCRGLGQRARWAPVVKMLTNQSTIGCTRYLRPCAATIRYFPRATSRPR